MSIAVVIPLYNGAPWIRGTIESVLGQTLSPAEVVVVDDGSTDGSPDLVDGVEGVRILHNPGKGANVARNYGLEKTRSPYVAFLDQDDSWHPGHLGRLADALDETPDAPAAVSSLVPLVDGAEIELSDTPRKRERLDPWEGYPLAAPIWTASVALIRRTAITPPSAVGQSSGLASGSISALSLNVS